jgi:NagD protein
MRQALDRLGGHSKETVMIGDRMDTDIVGGIESEFTTVLVLSGVTQQADIASYAYQPDYILPSVGEIVR